MNKKTILLLFFGIWLLTAAPPRAGAFPGDSNGDNQVDTTDVGHSLRILSSAVALPAAGADVDQDRQVGMAETLYALQSVAGQRTLPVLFDLKTLSGHISLPAGFPTPLDSLTVLNPAGEAHPDAQGAFTVPCLGDGASLNSVLSPAGNVMLLGWLNAGHATISPRTTAEVMLFFALGADRYPAEERENLRLLLTVASEITPLADAISAALSANVDAFAGENATVTSAMTSVIETFHAGNFGAASVLIEPADEKSGLAVRAEGVNQITLTNAYRRRVRVWIDQIAYVPAGGGGWVEAKMPLTSFEIMPVAGLKSLMGTVNDYVVGYLAGSEKVAYKPVSSEPVALPLLPKSAEKTAYEVIACGNGLADGDILTLPSDRLTAYAATGANFLVFDVILPAIINIIAPQTSVPEILKKITPEKSDFAMLLKNIQAAPGLMATIAKGDYAAAVTTIRSTMLDTYKGDIVNGLLALMTTTDGAPPAAAVRAEQGINAFLNWTKVFNAALTAADIKVIETHGLLSKKMETWRVEVMPPKVTLTPAKAIILPEATQTFTVALAEASGTGAPALTYRWMCTNLYGTLTDGIHTGADFTSSLNTVTYTGSSLGTDTVEVEAFEVQGQDRVPVENNSATVEVASAKVSIDKTLADVAQGAALVLKGKLEPAPTAGQVIRYNWASACAFGRFNGGNPFESDLNQLVYIADSALEGTDTVVLTAYRLEGAERVALGQATATIRVWAAPKKAAMTFHTYGPTIMYHTYQAPNWSKPHSRWLIYGWGWSWTCPEGMHRTGDVANLTRPTQTVPYEGRYYDEPYKMGLDLRSGLGVAAGVNFETRMVAKSIGLAEDAYTLRDMINEGTKRLNIEREGWKGWQGSTSVEMDCIP